jgi:hypothetical protein
MYRWFALSLGLLCNHADRYFRWKDSIEERLRRMEDMMNRLARGSSVEHFSQHTSQHHSPEAVDEHIESQNHRAGSSSRTHDQLQRPWEVIMDPGSGPGAIPASCVAEAPNSPFLSKQRPPLNHGSDIVSRGIISLATVEKHFRLYRQRLDPIVYNILAEHDSLASLRGKSALLVAVVCAVSALHSASPDYQICYQAFRNEFATQLLSKEHSFDDVRALCIGAFFLSDMSWILVGAGQSTSLSFILFLC